MKAWHVATLAVTLALGGCSSTSTDDGGNGGGPPVLPDTESELDGAVFGASRSPATEQTPLVGARVVARLLPGAGAILATATTNPRGEFFFSLATNNTVPRGRTLFLSVETDERRVYGVLNTVGPSSRKSLNEVTHLAALAMRKVAETSFTDNQIARYESAARAALEAALSEDPEADFTAAANQTDADRLAGRIRDDVDLGGIENNDPPTLGNVAITPTQLSHLGGTVNLSVEASDSDGDPLEVSLLVFDPDGAPPAVHPLALSGGAYTGTLALGPNDGTQPHAVQIAVVADDGRGAGTPQVSRTITVLPEGRVTLDVLVETLFDEPASRARLDGLFDGQRPRLRRDGGRARTRQVNPNQTIRGARVELVDQPSLNGVTGNDGLLLLDVPMRYADDGLLTLVTSLAGRQTYRQFLVLPEDIDLFDGDVIEIDLVLAPRADWVELGDLLDLPALNFSRVPLTAFFNVLDDVDVGVISLAQANFRPLSETDRQDDGDYFVANLPAATISAEGSFADANDPTDAPEFGPLDLPLEAGQIHAVSALLPPE